MTEDDNSPILSLASGVIMKTPKLAHFPWEIGT